MNEIFFLVEEDKEGGYIARAIGEAIFTEADTLEELKVNIKDATDCHFDSERPTLIRLHIVREEVISYV